MKLLQKISCVSILLYSSLALAEETKPQASYSASEVVPGLYMLMGVNGFAGGNIALSIGSDGVVMIDDSMPPMLDNMKKAIKTVTDKPVDFLLNTHVHYDHTGNNVAMGKTGAHIIAHENLRARLKAKTGEDAVAKEGLPVLTFSHNMHIHLNDNDVHVFHVANAHTDGDAIIHFKNLNVIHTGDTMFNGMFPYIDYSNGGSVAGYIAAQKKVLSLADDKTKIIPGHGALASKKDLAASIAMLENSQKIIQDLINQGKNEEEIVKLNPLKKYHEQWNWGFITTEKMTRQIYKGLKK